MADFTELEKTFDVASEVVTDVRKVGIQKPPKDRDKTDIRNDTNTQEAIYTLSLRKDKKQLTEFLNLLKRVTCQEHTKLLDN